MQVASFSVIAPKAMSHPKTALRQQLKSQRLATDRSRAVTASQTIIAKATSAIEWKSIQTLHTYLPFAKYHEVATQPLLDMLWANYPYIKTATWQKQADDYICSWLSPDGKATAVDAGQQFSVIVVPMLGFTKDCFRIGFGSGFYDRFLASQPHATTIGLCYQSGLCSFTPEKHDIPLDTIVTETQTFVHTDY